jgi:hypothetical protein
MTSQEAAWILGWEMSRETWNAEAFFPMIREERATVEREFHLAVPTFCDHDWCAEVLRAALNDLGDRAADYEPELDSFPDWLTRICRRYARVLRGVELLGRNGGANPEQERLAQAHLTRWAMLEPELLQERAAFNALTRAGGYNLSYPFLGWMSSVYRSTTLDLLREYRRERRGVQGARGGADDSARQTADEDAQRAARRERGIDSPEDPALLAELAEELGEETLAPEPSPSEEDPCDEIRALAVANPPRPLTREILARVRENCLRQEGIPDPSPYDRGRVEMHILALYEQLRTQEYRRRRLEARSNDQPAPARQPVRRIAAPLLKQIALQLNGEPAGDLIRCLAKGVQKLSAAARPAGTVKLLAKVQHWGARLFQHEADNPLVVTVQSTLAWFARGFDAMAVLAVVWRNGLDTARLLRERSDASLFPLRRELRELRRFLRAGNWGSHFTGDGPMHRTREHLGEAGERLRGWHDQVNSSGSRDLLTAWRLLLAGLHVGTLENGAARQEELHQVDRLWWGRREQPAERLMAAGNVEDFYNRLFARERRGNASD